MAVQPWAENILEDLKKTNEEKSKGVYSRETLKKQPGQVLVVDKVKFKAILGEIFVDMTRKQLKDIWGKWKGFLETQASKGRASLDEDRVKEIQEAIKDLKLSKDEHAFIVTNYPAIRQAKAAKGELGTYIKSVYGEAKALQTGQVAENAGAPEGKSRLDLIGGQGSKKGAQLGHEEAGQGVATSVGAAASAEARLRALGFDGRSRAIKTIQKYYNDLELQIDHTQIVDAKGGLIKKYVPILFWQGALSNNEQAQTEKALAEAFQKKLEKDIATMPGSTTLIDAVGQVVFDGASPDTKRKNTKTKGEKAKRVEDRSRGKAKTKVARQRPLNVIHDAGVDIKSISKLEAKAKKRATSPFSYMAMINKRLAQTVRKNMGAPGLENQSGRFAGSVRVQDANRTAQGYPSFGYTYEKDPYQVFEVGEGAAPWASSQRDPRRLIDKSIRAVSYTHLRAHET